MVPSYPMSLSTQIERKPSFSSPCPFNNPAGIVTGVRRYGAALDGCGGIRAISHCGRSPHWASGAAESRREPDGAMHGDPEGCR